MHPVDAALLNCTPKMKPLALNFTELKEILKRNSTFATMNDFSMSQSSLIILSRE